MMYSPLVRRKASFGPYRSELGSKGLTLFPTNTKELISETHQLGQAIFGVSLHYTKICLKI